MRESALGLSLRFPSLQDIGEGPHHVLPMCSVMRPREDDAAMRKHVCRHVRLLFSLVREPLEPLQQAFLDVCVLEVSSLFSSPRTACVRFTGGFCVVLDQEVSRWIAPMLHVR